MDVGREWRRVQVTYRPAPEAKLRRGLEARVSLEAQGQLWLAAPQLEAGDRPTAFAPALGDDQPLPLLPWPGDDAWTPPSAQHARALVVDRRPGTLSAIAIEYPTPRQLKDIADHGFAGVLLFVATSPRAAAFAADRARASAEFDAAAAAGLKVVAMLCHAPAAPIAVITADTVETIDALKAHPALACWVILDEPSRQWDTPPWGAIASLRAAAAAADPGRPMIVNENRWPADADGMLQATDVGSMDAYPIGQYANSLKVVADLSSRLNRSCAAAGKPSAMWLQTYGYDDAVREPTPDEYRAMAHATFVHGSRLLVHWIYKPMSARLWAAIADVHRELARLSALVCGDDARCLEVGTRSGRVHYAVWSVRRQLHLIACNIAPESVFVRFNRTIDGAARDVVGAWYEAGFVRALGAHLWARFPPFARQVWQLS